MSKQMEYFAHSQREFVYKYVVLLSDTDQFKHMSFANYLKLMFLATDALLISVQSEKFLSEYRLKLTSSRMQFRKQTVPGEKTLIKINAASLSQNTFALLYTYLIEGTGELVGLARQTYRLTDVTLGDCVETMPDALFAILKQIEVVEEHLLYKY